MVLHDASMHSELSHFLITILFFSTFWSLHVYVYSTFFLRVFLLGLSRIYTIILPPSTLAHEAYEISMVRGVHSSGGNF